MSTEHSVTYRSIADSIEDSVLSILAHQGYACELAPNMDLLKPDNEVLLVKINEYASAKPRVRPERQFIVGLELSDMPCSNKQGSRTLTFRTTAGSSSLSYAIQILVAAAFAETVGGELEDPQEGLILKAPHAVSYAFDQISRREPPHDLRESEFVAWA